MVVKPDHDRYKMTSSSDEESVGEKGLSLSDALLKTTQELLRQYESGSFDEFSLAEGVVKLLRVAVLQSTDARAAVIELCEEISKRVQEKCIVESLASAIFDIVAVGDSDEFGTVQNRIENLVTQVCSLEGGLLESLASCLTADGDVCHILILAEEEAGVIEYGIDQAMAEGVNVEVTIVVAYEDMEESAEKMKLRLEKLGIHASTVLDANVESAAKESDVAIVRAVGMLAEEDALCMHGSALVCAGAWRAGIPVMVVGGTHTITAEGSAAMNVMTRMGRHPGSTWKYDECREDRGREAISIVAPAYDRVALQKVHTVLTERGCFATDFLKVLAPRAGRVEQG